MIDSDNRDALDNYGVWVKKAPKDIQPVSENNSDDSFDIAADLPDFSSLDSISTQTTTPKDDFDSGETSLTSEELMNIAEDISDKTLDEESIPPLEDNISIEDSFELPSESEIANEDESFDAVSETLSEEPIDETPMEQVSEEQSVPNENAISDILSQNTQVDDDAMDFEISFEDPNEIDQDLDNEQISEKAEDVNFDVIDTDDITTDIKSEEISDSPKDKTEENLSIPDSFEEETSSFITEEEPENNLNTSSAPSNTNDEILMRSNAILEQIQKELSSLRSEISTLKNDFNELKTNSTTTQPTENKANDIHDKEKGGFFSDVDEDETISLSGDELNNIMNNADFSEETIEQDNSEESVTTEETSDFTTDDENETESFYDDFEKSDDLSVDFENEHLVEPELNDLEINVSEEESEKLPDEIIVPKIEDVLVESSGSDFMDETKEESIPIEASEPVENLAEDEIIDKISEESDELEMPSIDDLSEQQEETAEEPIEEVNTDETSIIDNEILNDMEMPIIEEPIVDNIEEAAETEEVASDSTEEFSIDDMPSIDEPIVDNIEESTETEEVASDSTEEFSIDDMPSIDEPIVDNIEESTETEEVTSDSTEEFSIDDMPSIEEPSVDNIEESEETTTESTDEFSIDDMPSIDEPIVDNIEESTETEEAATESTEDLSDTNLEAEEPNLETEESFDTLPQTIDDLYPQDPPIEDALTDDNIDYLKEDKNNIVEDEAIQEEPEDIKTVKDMPEDLTKDIKSILKYMDTLLENLPDDKISEFAQSEQFVTYKKLFTELGLA